MSIEQAGGQDASHWQFCQTGDPPSMFNRPQHARTARERQATRPRRRRRRAGAPARGAPDRLHPPRSRGFGNGSLSHVGTRLTVAHFLI